MFKWHSSSSSSSHSDSSGKFVLNTRMNEISFVLFLLLLFFSGFSSFRNDFIVFVFQFVQPTFWKCQFNGNFKSICKLIRIHTYAHNAKFNVSMRILANHHFHLSGEFDKLMLWQWRPCHYKPINPDDSTHSFLILVVLFLSANEKWLWTILQFANWCWSGSPNARAIGKQFV